MYVAPLTTSIFALPAFSASSRRIGSARALIASVRALSPLSSTVSTLVSSPPVSVTRISMIENGVVAVSVAVRTFPGRLGRLLLTRRTSGSAAATLIGGGWAASPGRAIAGGRERTLASRPTTAAVATATGTARRATLRALVTRSPR